MRARASEQQNASEFSKCLNWSGCRELNPGLTHPKGKYCRCTTPRSCIWGSNLLSFADRLDALGAGLDPIARSQPDPLEVGVFPGSGSGIVFAPEFYQFSDHDRSFSANGANFSHSDYDISGSATWRMPAMIFKTVN